MDLRRKAMFNGAKHDKGSAHFLDDLDTDLADAYTETIMDRQFLGMTAGQRFVVALLLMLTVAVVGVLCLVVTGKVLLF
jgi:hypothetical protein